MNDRVPWHVKGVRRQVRDTAREAARRSGMSVGQWLNNLIIQQTGGHAPGPRHGQDWRDDGDDHLTQSIDRLDRRLDQLISQGRLSNGHPAQHHPHPQQHQPYPPYRQPAPQYHPQQPGPPNGHYPPPPNGRYAPPPPPQQPYSSGVDQAVAEIAARQRALDIDPVAPRTALPPIEYGYRAAPPPPPYYAAPSADLSGLEQQLRNITSQIEGLTRPHELTGALSELRKDLAEIGRTLTEAMPRRALDALENEVRKLAERIDLSRSAGVDPSTVANMERGLADVREALQSLTPAESLVGFDEAVRGLSRKLDQMTVQQDPTNLQQLEAAITALRGIVSHVASNDAVIGLAEEVRGLAAKVDRVASQAAGQMEGITQASSEPVLGAIERGFSELTNRLVELQRHAPGSGGSANEPAVDDLKRDLARTQDSLEAVHGTLGLVVSRLAMIEGGQKSSAPAAPSHVPAPPLVPEGPSQAASSPRVAPPAPPPPQSAGPASPPHAARPMSGPPAMRDRQPIDPNLPPDFPLEPGSGTPRMHPPGSAAERIAASEAVLGSAKPSGANHPGQTNFIAAARRAAQAAGPAAGDAPKAAPAGTDKPKSLTQRMRALIVGGSAVLIVIASMSVALNLIEPVQLTLSEPAAPSPPQIIAQQPAPVPIPEPSGLAAVTESKSLPPSGLLLPADEPKVVATKPAAQTEADFTGSVAALDPRPSLPDRLPAALRQAAAAGDPAAEYEVAVRHLDGRGVPQSLEEAARWLERAARTGLAPAQFRLGGLYEKGQGVKKNLETARRHYVAAANKGNAKAMHNLAVMYSEGVDGQADYKTAAHWFRKAAEHGIADSQHNLAILYARGVGVERNLAESYKWFALAAAQGDRDSAQKRDDVAARLDQGSLMAAKLAAQSFVPDQQPDEAVTVKSPPGGWDRTAGGESGKKPAKKQRPAAPTKVTPS